MNNILPEMTVEYRVTNETHGIPAPDLSESNMMKELGYAIQLNHDFWGKNWEDTTIDIIQKYIGIKAKDYEIVDSVKEIMNHNSWKDCSIFVQKDMCSDFFNRCLSFCLDKKLKHKSNYGFIDGHGIGYLQVYRDDLKISLEKAFDVKYAYKVPRPLQYAKDIGLNLIDTANFIHPGHWSYIAGHGTKFYQAVYTCCKLFHVPAKVRRVMLIAAGTEAMARSGNLIHYPMDNCLGERLAA